MSNPSKSKGTAGETRVVRWLQDNGFPGARRLPLAGNRDQGDLYLQPGLMAEVKNVKEWSRSDVLDWLKQTHVERVNGGWERAVLIVLNHGKTVGQAWAITCGFDGRPRFMWLQDWTERQTR